MTHEELNRRRVTRSVPEDEREHFITCPACGLTFDCRRLGDVLEHEGRCAGPATYPGGKPLPMPGA